MFIRDIFKGDKILYVKIDSKGKMKILAEQ
ncbi:hypothetical protein ACISIM_08565, partial [Campylobacter coli]